MREFEVKVEKIKELLSSAEHATTKFQKVYKIGCFSGCGKCCSTESIEASSLEFLPLAEYLWKKGEAAELLEKLKDADSLENCIFYIPNCNDKTKGFCAAYEHRGLICRLFGFSLRQNKNGMNEVITCKEIKEKYSLSNISFKDEEHEFNMSDYYLQLADIDYSRAFKRYPVNKAIAEALNEYAQMNSY